MLQAHSLLWHYLWVAPNLLLLLLAVLLWRRKLHEQYPIFLIFAVVTPTELFVLYAADVIPSVSGDTFWRIAWGSLLVEALVKFALIGEIFSRVFGLYPSLAKLGRSFITGVGVVLVLLATVAAAHTPKDNIHWIVSGAHILEQTIYLIECGLILFLFLFAAYFKLSWSRSAFGITLGLGCLGHRTSCNLGTDGERGIPCAISHFSRFPEHGRLSRFRADLVLLPARPRKEYFQAGGSSAASAQP